MKKDGSISLRASLFLFFPTLSSPFLSFHFLPFTTLYYFLLPPPPIFFLTTLSSLLERE